MNHARTCLAVLAGLVLAATGAWAAAAQEEPAAAMEKEMVTDPTTGEMVTAPQYGGTLTAATPSDPAGSDAYFGHPTMKAIEQVCEMLAGIDWGVDRDEYGFNLIYVPDTALTGRLAERWEMSADGLTLTFHIREGVHWHDKAPMNGRELTAEDVAYNWRRYTGLGSGFTEFSPNIAQWSGLDDLGIASITATDRYTVVFTLEQPNLQVPREILWPYPTCIMPPEVIEQHGDVTDWRNLVGTGPFELTDWVEGSSLTFDKNPNYWGFDEKYPDNRLPYVDRLQVMIMPDETTRLAALRTGKVDYLGYLFYGHVNSVNTIEQLQQSNPDLQVFPSYRESAGIALSAQNPPFNDVRVRHAIQMAIDVETIANTYFKGWSLGPPQGFLGGGLVGFVPAFEDWPEEIRQYYTYDPAGAEALLDEAGYPRGADGIRIKAGLDFRDVYDLGHYELAVAQLGEIGVEVELKPMDSGTWAGRLREHTYDGMTSEAVGFEHSIGQLGQNTSAATWNPAGVQDPAYDALAEAVLSAATKEELIRRVGEAAMYLTENHWHVWLGRPPWFTMVQPWVIGYNGEVAQESGVILGRVWIDQDLKKQMGF